MTYLELLNIFVTKKMILLIFFFLIIINTAKKNKKMHFFTSYQLSSNTIHRINI